MGQAEPVHRAEVRVRERSVFDAEPRALVRAAGDDPVVIWPRRAPESAADALMTAAAALVILAELFVLPVLTWFAFGGGSSPWGWAAAQLVWLVQVFAAARDRVGWLKIGARGIVIGRRGKPLLPWSDVVAIRPAEAIEVIVHGWLWPPVPPREGTTSLTSRGHFAIEHRGGVSYFPPDDSDAFLDAVERWAPQVLRAAAVPSHTIVEREVGDGES